MGDGKRKAKLKDTVPVCLVGDGREGKRHENIESSDEIKRLPSKAFGLGGLKRIKMSPGSFGRIFASPRNFKPLSECFSGIAVSENAHSSGMIPHSDTHCRLKRITLTSQFPTIQFPHASGN